MMSSLALSHVHNDGVSQFHSSFSFFSTLEGSLSKITWVPTENYFKTIAKLWKMQSFSGYPCFLS